MKKNHILYVYTAKDGFRWRCVAANGNVVADGGQAYSRKSSAKRAAKRFVAALADVVIV